MRPSGPPTTSPFPMKGGFSLVELLAAMAAAAILALTAGAMLWYGYLGWTRARGSVELQRDMRAATDIFTRAARAGTNLVASTGTVFTVEFSDRPTASLFASGSSLVYDPDTASSGDQITVANGTLQSFDVSLAGNLTTLVLVLNSAGETLSNRVVISRRN